MQPRRVYLRNLQVLCLLAVFIAASFAGCLSNKVSFPKCEDKDNCLTIAFEAKEEYRNTEENPQEFADRISELIGMDVEIYPVTGAAGTITALKYGHADVGFLDGGAAWLSWQTSGLEVLAAEQKADGRPYYNAIAWVHKDSDMAKADLDKATKEIATGRKDTASLQKNIDKFRVMNAELNGSIKALESEIAAEKESTAEMREAILDSRAECENLKSRLQAKDDELESAWSALMCVNADLKHALHDASGMRALVEKRSEELEETNVNVDRLRELNAMLIERLHRAKKATLEAEALNAEFAAARTQAEVTIRQEEAKVAAL